MVDTSEYSVQSKLEAEVIDDTPKTYLVRFPDGQVGSVSKTSTDGVLCGIDGLDPHVPVIARGQALLDDKYVDEYGATGISVSFELNFEDATGEIVVNGNDRIEITGSDLTDLLVTVTDKLEDGEDGDVSQTGLELNRYEANHVFDIYEEIVSSRVRKDIINKLAGEFYGVSEVGDEGWVIQDAYLVTYEAENYLIGDIETFSVSGGNVVKNDSEPQGIKLSFNAPPMAEVSAGGSDYILSEPEQEFLATVEVLTSPDAYLGVDTFEEEAYNAIQSAKYGTNRNHIQDVALDSEVKSYVDPKTGLLHRHEVYKHTLTDNFGVKPWVIQDLEYNSWDHAGVAELAYREQELRDADRDVFMDTANDDDERWQRIQSVENQAPCPPQVYRKLKGMFGPRQN